MDVTSSDRFVGVGRFLHIRSTGRFRKPGTLESNMRDVFLLVRILRVKNRRGLSLRQMEEDVLCIPKDGG